MADRIQDTDPHRDKDEVRAGPGDAGRQDRPETLPRPPGDRRRGRQASGLLIGLVIFGLIVWVLMALAA